MKDSICVFGDSIMKGVIFDAIRGRYTYLKNSFQYFRQAHRYCQSGQFREIRLYDNHRQKIIEKHAVKLPNTSSQHLSSGNDCDFDWKSISECPDDIHLPKTPLDEFESLYCQIIDDVSESGSKPVLFTLPPLGAKRYFSWISRGLNAENILRWLGDVEHIYRWHEMYNNAVLKIAAAKNVLLIDIREAFLKTRDYLTLLCEDGIHPNEAGHALISDVVMKAIPAIT